jgi:hypothetical protein
VDAVKELAPLPQRQCSHLLQYFIRTHSNQHTTAKTARASPARDLVGQKGARRANRLRGLLRGQNRTFAQSTDRQA